VVIAYFNQYVQPSANPSAGSTKRVASVISVHSKAGDAQPLNPSGNGKYELISPNAAITE